MADDANENSDQEKESRNKREFVSELEIEPLSKCPQLEVETPPDEEDWEDTTACQLLVLLTQNLSTIFQSAVKRIADCGYSEETAERVILMSGIYHGSKDAVSNIVDGALALLCSWEKDFDSATNLIFADLPSLVDYTLLEMVGVLREVKPDLTVAEAMWCLLITDLNLVHACTMEADLLVELCCQESPGDSSSGLKLPQSRTENSENTPIAQILQSKVPVASAAPQEPESKGQGSSAPLPKAEDKSKAVVLEDKSGEGRKAILSKKDLYKRKTFQFEKNSRSRKNIKANITAWSSLVSDKKLKSSSSPDATKKCSHTKVDTLVKSNKPSAKVTDTSSVPPMQDNVNEKDPDLLAMEPKCNIKAPENTAISSVVPDYYADIPYDESLGKYVPQNERDEAILLLTSRLKTLQKELQGWSDWANEKVMQATRRLGKDRVELKMLRQEKEDVEKVLKETEMLEEDARMKIMELEQSLVNTNYIFEKTNSYLKGLERKNVVLEKEMEAEMLSAAVDAMNMDNALAKEQEAMKKCQAADSEKRLFEEDLSTFKQETAALQQQQEKAHTVVHQFEVLSKHEEKVKQRSLLQKGDSLKAETEQIHLKGKALQDNFTEKVERNKLKCKEDEQKLESEISQLRLQSERAKIEALKRDIPQMTKGLAAYAECSGSNVVKMEWECVMCMNEKISTLFLPCAHEVLCEDCNVLHQKKGMEECPSCRIPIKERISVRFPDSLIQNS